MVTSFVISGQNTRMKYNSDKQLDDFISHLIDSLDLKKKFDVGEDGEEEISFAVITFGENSPVLSGWNYDNFIYPASVYKMFVAASILEQISDGKMGLYNEYIVKAPNNVDRNKEIKTDPRPLLMDGDKVTINYLMDLMISRSDNSAANCCIDIADRKNINKLIHKYGWKGSEVTRKYLSRKYEDPGYEKIRGTETCALHAAEFMYLIETNGFVNPYVSMQLKSLLGRQLDKSKLAAGLPENVMMYHKTGWFSYWTNDVGIVADGELKYVISLFLPIEEEKALPLFKKISSEVYSYLKINRIEKE